VVSLPDDAASAKTVAGTRKEEMRTCGEDF